MTKLTYLFKNHLILIILVFAATLRFIGIYPGHDAYHADEPIIWSSALQMIIDNTLDPGRYDYPPVSMYINYIFFKIFFIPLSWVIFYLSRVSQIVDGTLQLNMSALEAKRTFHTFIIGSRGVNAMYWSRYITALFSIGNVFLIYVLGEKLFSKKVGLIAAVFLTFNFRQVLNSHITLPDIYNSFFLILSLITTTNLWKRPTRANYLISGLVAGVCYSTKYQIFSLFPLLLTHFYIAYRDKRRVKDLVKQKIPLSFCAFLLTILVLNPFFFINFEDAIHWILSVSSKYGLGVFKINLYPVADLYHFDYGFLESALLVLGIFVGLRKYFQQTLLILSVVMPFAFVFLYYSSGGFYARNFITITPEVLLLSALGLWGIYSITSKFIPRVFNQVFFLVSLIFIILVPARNAIISSYFYTKPWNYNVLSEWLYENLPSNTKIAAHPFDPPTGAPPLQKTEFEINGSYSMAEHKENGAEYALINMGWAGNPFYWWMNYGIGDAELFWNKPTELLRNFYHGIAIEEMLKYRIFAISKPWQAPDNGLVVVKFPVWPSVEFLKVKNYSFDKDIEGWQVRDATPGGATYVFEPEVGNLSKGSTLFVPGRARFPTRAASPVIPVVSGHLYKISGFLKSESKLTLKERDGFIRADFYKEGVNISEIGLQSSVSSRVYGDNNWVKKEITILAPDDANFLVVGFQISNVGLANKFWIDDVEVEESKDVVDDPTTKTPYAKDIIYPDLLYPNSHGNL